MTADVEGIQHLLALYFARKNAQGEKEYDSAPVVAYDRGILHFPIDPQMAERLRRRLFYNLRFKGGDKGIVEIHADPHTITCRLLEAVDRVAVYPDTDHLNVILQKFGARYHVDVDGRPTVASPAVLPYPIGAKPLSQFEIASPRLIDSSAPEEGVVVSLPYCKYDDTSVRDANLTVLILALMGLKLPFPDCVIEGIKAQLKSNRPLAFPSSHVPIDGVIGRKTLAAYDSNSSGLRFHFVIMEEPSRVSACLARAADQIKKTPWVGEIPKPAFGS